MNPIHRIDPRLLSVPEFYGSAGEPSILTMSKVGGPFNVQQPRGSPIGLLLGLASMGLLGPQEAQSPQMGLLALEKPNDEPLDVMPDDMPFKKAFAKARKMGLVEFTWRSKPYTTKLKE